ncbi:MAG: hypothetical protein LH465_03265 [Sphingomonas bacterium]|nr:hypothetical protein [Sphingomonas bacterium]
MAHVLIGWELGANRGHAVRMAALGAALRNAGHEVSFAVQRIDALSEAEAGGSLVWQAPVTPRLLISGSSFGGAATTSMADTLARLGFDDGGIVAAMINGWHRLIAAIRPAVVIADYAPFLLLAVRGRVPSIAIGTAFSQPPANMQRLPQLIEGQGAVDQPKLLATINRALASVGTPPLAALPRLFEADRMIPASFAELDPYAADRGEILASPLPADFTARAGSGEEVFVYAPERIAPDAPLWRGLAASGLAVRIHPQRAQPVLLNALAGHGFSVEAEPVDFATIAARSRIVVSHGGHGFACAAMAAGLPQVVCPHDLEKLLHGMAVAREGLGGHVSMRQLNPGRFGADLVTFYRDEALAQRTRARAEMLRRRDQPDFTSSVVASANSLV